MTTRQIDLFYRAVALVSMRCGVTVSELDSTTRRYPVMFARHVLVYLLRHQAEMTLQEIGLLLKRNHGAVYHSLRSLEDSVQTDCAIARRVASLVGEFQHSK